MSDTTLSASCCGEPRVTPTVDRCYDHAKVCCSCGQPSEDGSPDTCCLCTGGYPVTWRTPIRYAADDLRALDEEQQRD